MVAGFLFLWAKASLQVAKKNRQLKGFEKQLFRSKKKSGGHLKLIIDNEQSQARKRDDDFDNGPKTWH